MLTADQVTLTAAEPIDSAIAAPLIWATDPHIFGGMHGDDHALGMRHLAAQWSAEGGLFSHTFAHMVTFDGRLAGIELGFDKQSQEQALEVMVGVAASVLSEQEIATMIGFFEYGGFLIPAIPDDAYYLQNLAVVETGRGKGIGEKLLHHCFDKARQRGHTRVHLDVYEGNPAIRLYQRCGFQTIVRTVVTPFSEAGMPDHLRMELKL